MRRPNTVQQPDLPEVDYLPPDLRPLPIAPDSDDDEAIRTALYLNFGNVGLAARALGRRPGELARQIELFPSLRADREAARRMIVDQSEQVVIEQLLDENDIERRDDAAKFVLTSLGRTLGWGQTAQASQAGFSLSDGSGRTLQVKWQSDGE